MSFKMFHNRSDEMTYTAYLNILKVFFCCFYVCMNDKLINKVGILKLQVYCNAVTGKVFKRHIILYTVSIFLFDDPCSISIINA